MAKKDSDILLIRKYLNGQLDARAMHQLEARAQDDPFLMDALEGYEKTGRDQQPTLAELRSRLQQRVERKEVRWIIPFRVLAIAASVLVVFSIGWLLIVRNKPETPPQIAVNVKPNAKTTPAASIAKDTVAAVQLAAKSNPAAERIAIMKPDAPATKPRAQYEPGVVAPVAAADTKAVADKSILAEVAASKNDTADSTPLNEMVVMNYNQNKKKEVFKDTDNSSSVGFIANTSPKPSSTVEQRLVSKAAGVTNTPGFSPLSSPGSQRFFLQGRIIDEIDGQPLPGVSVRAAGSSYGAITDRNGKFSVPSDSLKRGLVVSRLGYNTAKINAAKGDSIKTISLAPSDFPLKEVAITGNVKNPAAAHPQIGWNKYNKYLENAAVSPDGKTGRVELSFSIDKIGSITGVAIVTGLSDAANKKAIELVNKGPKWVGNANSKSEQVELTINF